MQLYRAMIDRLAIRDRLIEALILIRARRVLEPAETEFVAERIEDAVEALDRQSTVRRREHPRNRARTQKSRRFRGGKGPK